MNIKQGLLGVVGILFGCSIATASNMVISLQGGYASNNAGGDTQDFTGTDSDVFTYTDSESAKNTGFIGVFLGAEHTIPWVSHPDFFMQTGIEYNYFGKTSVNGVNTAGVEPQTSTTYNYNYDFQTQQVLGTLKLFATAYKRFHPYGEVGLGVAFNHAGQYNATTAETGSINLTPGFDSQTQTQFSYIFGLGVDTQVSTKIRLGLGYRYSNFGASSLENGMVTFNNYHSPVSFELGSANTYANQLMARISYVF